MEEERLVRLQREFDALGGVCCGAADPYEVAVPAEDGVPLRTVVTLPDAAGPFPTILMRSCYPQAEAEYRLTAREYARRGFGFVYQFCRGTGGSGGVWEPNVNERRDGLVTARWLAAQPFAGRCGYLGCSYLAFTGWVMADALPDCFATLYLTHYGTDRFASAYQEGMFRQDILTGWAMQNAGFPVTADYLESCRYRPQIEVDEALWGGRLDWYRDWITHTDPDDPYWNEGLWGALRQVPGKLNLPVYIGSGWYDHHLGGTVRGYEALSPAAAAHSVLRIGAWNHWFENVIPGKPAEHLENSDTASALRWFTEILKEGRLPRGGVQLYNIGADRWETLDRMPAGDLPGRQLFLDGAARALTPAQPQCPQPLQYRYDPGHPVPSHGGESLFSSKEEIGSLPQPEPDWRPDVVSFVSDPLTEPLALRGEIRVRLQVASDCADTAFTAKLLEVAPDGSARNIRGGITSLGYRCGAPHRLDYRPSERAEIEIRMWPISWTLAPGCRLRLDLSSSNFPEYAAHPNCAGGWALARAGRVATQTIFGGSVLLPVAE